MKYSENREHVQGSDFWNIRSVIIKEEEKVDLEV